MIRRFRTAITAVLVLFTLLPVSLVGAVLVRQVGEAIRADAERDLRLVAESVVDRLGQQLTASRVLAQALAGDTDVFLATRSLLFWRDAQQRLQDFLAGNSLVSKVVLIDTDDRVVVAQPQQLELPAPVRLVVPEAEALVRRDLHPAQGNLEAMLAAESLFLAFPIRTQSGMPGRAKLLVEFTLERMRNYASEAIPPGLRFELVTTDVARNGKSDKDIIAENDLTDEYLSMGGLARIRVLDSTASRLRAMRETIFRASAAIVALAALVAVLAFLASRRFLSPLDQLVRSVASIASPDAPLTPATYRFQEFQVLGDTIIEQKRTIALQFEELNRKMETLHELNERLRALRSASEEAQLNALKAQMNPHMLFNTLNSILSMMDLDVACASKMLSNLAELYRLILAASKKAVSDVGTEVRIVSLYLELERIRFADRMTYRIDVSPSVRRLPIPGLVLQTLVENGVKHGIAKAREGGDVELRISTVEPERHLVRVSNSGAPLGRLDAGDGDGTGVANTRRRLELLYGANHGFRIFTDGDGRTVAEFHIVENAHEAKNLGC